MTTHEPANHLLLPPELFHHHIFLFLDTKTLKKSISLLCRNFYEWVSENVRSLVLDFKLIPSINQKKAIYECASGGSFRNIQSLTLKNVNDGVKGLFVENNWTKLTSLHIVIGRLGLKDLEEVCSLKQLTSLSLRNNSQITNDIYTNIAELKHLTRLNLSGLHISNNWYYNFVKFGPTGLKSLNLSCCNIEAAQLNLIGTLSTLESLNLEGYTNLSTLESIDKWNMPSLTYLNLENRPFSKSLGDVCKLTSLRTLNMSNCGISDKMSWELISLNLFPNLTSLDASHNNLSISWFQNNAPNLTNLNLTCCGIDDTEIIQLFSGIAPKLAILDVSENEVTDDGISTISTSPYASSLRSITYVSTNNIFVITDLSMKFISNSPYLENLTQINFSGNQIYAKGLLYLSQSSLVNLKVLKLCRTNITESSFREFMKSGNMKRLCEIDFTNSIYLDKSVCRKAFPYLKRLNRVSVFE
ncbi:leucine rich repeat domain protein [Naegleria gruberi]|uniref:Leucine rich repeat domain protein n=1 Tax=Naegleria gruberi TaxID=5762 RepID=D2W282_NAEGR|nr:leucine rich repeat domain protein [Naegleria gruberi]EFC36820.1 leucine rich repeat domain protein [Naegleria gruberi]|eukprot:XP_002669564.1 leucine rich repeat domain protein [Naegleria gruberi strain NEG-M]